MPHNYNTTDHACLNDTITNNGLATTQSTGLIGLTLAISTIIINAILLYKILRKEITRAFNILIANLAFVSIVAAILGALYISGVDNLLEYAWICSALSLIRNSCVNLVSLSVLSITYERVRSLDSTLTNETELWKHAVRWIWTLSFLAAIPSFFITVIVQHTHTRDGEIHSVCMKIRPSDYYGTALVYEVCRCLMFHIAVPTFMISDLSRLCKTALGPLQVTERRSYRGERRVQQIRFIFIHSITFILLWVPFGIGISIYKNTTLLSRYERFAQHPELDCMDSDRSNSFYTLVFFFYGYILLLPLLLFWGKNATFSKFVNAYQGWIVKVENRRNDGGRSLEGSVV